MKFQPTQTIDIPDTLLCPISFLISPREIEVLHLLTKGFSSKQIAYSLGIAKNTVDNHRQNMLKKTRTQCTAELIAFALKNGLA